MANEVISYMEMCRREASSLQRGMNFDLGKGYSVVLMSVRRNAPYRDRFEDDGLAIVYEGHDVSKTKEFSDPKSLDQPEFTPTGTRTQNGKFFDAARAFTNGGTPPHRVRVYEKIHQGIWAYNGTFDLVDAWREHDGRRSVFKFKLVTSKDDSDLSMRTFQERRRVIPTSVKIAVWDRDQGKCVMCGARDELHFDHVLPFSKGGTSLRAENVQLLCARHNLSKSDKLL